MYLLVCKFRLFVRVDRIFEECNIITSTFLYVLVDCIVTNIDLTVRKPSVHVSVGLIKHNGRLFVPMVELSALAPKLLWVVDRLFVNGLSLGVFEVVAGSTVRVANVLIESFEGFNHLNAASISLNRNFKTLK
jgi:hypothetical protein